MNASAPVMVRFFCVGLLGIGLAACTSGEHVASDGPLETYGVVWSGDIRSATADTLMVKACWNDVCRSQVVPIAGLAPESSWDQFRSADPPAGPPSQTPRPQQTVAPQSWTGHKAGECNPVVEWVGELAISSCADIAGADVHLLVFLDLTVMGSRLRTGDTVSLHVTNEASDTSLVERTTTIDEAAPYYAERSIEE